MWSVPPALIIIGLTSGTTVGRAAFLTGWVLLGPGTAAVWAMAGRIVRHHSSQVRHLSEAVRTEWLSGLGFFLIDGGLGWLLVANVRFYFTSTLGILARPLPALGEGMRLGYVLGFLWIAPLALWALAQCYALPLLIEQRQGIGTALRRAALLVVDNIWFTLALAAVIVVVAAILLLTGVGAFVLLPGLLAVLTTNATRALLARYESDSRF